MNRLDTLMQIIKQRHSCRAYDSDRPVPDDALRHCLEAARQAPSACNKQPWRFVVIDDPEILTEIRERANLGGVANDWWRTAPVMVALGVDKNIVTHRLAPALSKIQYHLLDAGIAGEHFALAAASQGLATCWIGWFNQKAARKILQIPRGIDLVALFTLGYPIAEPKKRSSRKELDEIAFRNRWQQPIANSATSSSATT